MLDYPSNSASLPSSVVRISVAVLGKRHPAAFYCPFAIGRDNFIPSQISSIDGSHETHPQLYIGTEFPTILDAPFENPGSSRQHMSVPFYGPNDRFVDRLQTAGWVVNREPPDLVVQQFGDGTVDVDGEGAYRTPLETHIENHQ